MSRTLVLFQQGSEQVTDAAEWLRQLADSAQIVPPEAMQYILMEWIDKQEELDGAAEAAAGDDVDAEAEVEAEAEAGAAADTEVAAAAGMQAGSMSHDGLDKPHGSHMPSAASVSRQSTGEGCSRT